MVALHVVDSKRPLATRRCSGATSVLRYAPPADRKAILAAPTITDTTTNWTIVRAPSA